MSSLAVTTKSIFFDLESVLRQQLESQENENRKDLQDREIELREVKERRILNEKLIQELRPLCEELPPDALDPVTYELLDRGMVFRCGHTLNITTVVGLAKANGLCQQDAMECPSCKVKTPLKQTYSCYALRNCTEILKKISDVLKKCQSHPIV